MRTYGPTIQRNSKTMNYVKCSKYPRLAATHALSLNHHRMHRSHAWSMIVCQPYVASAYRYVAHCRMLTDPLL